MNYRHLPLKDLRKNVEKFTAETMPGKKTSSPNRGRILGTPHPQKNEVFLSAARSVFPKFGNVTKSITLLGEALSSPILGLIP